MPLLTLGGIFLIFYLTCACLIGLFHRRWSREEKLRYPVAEVAVELVGDSDGGVGMGVRNRWFWLGCVLALLFSLVYIVPACFGWKIPPVQFDFNALRPPPPWDAGAPGPYFRLNPILFGLGFLVSLNVLLTVWVGVVIINLEAVIANYFGVPYWTLFLTSKQEGVGAYVALMIVMVWACRKYIFGALKDVVGGGRPEEYAPGKWTLVGLFVGYSLLLFIFRKSGMVTWFGGIFLFMLLVRVLVMARVRAQAGIPNIYLHVFEARSMMWLLGGTALAVAGESTVAGLVFMSFLINCTFLTPYLADGFKISELTGWGYGRWIVLASIAVVVGFALAGCMQLGAMYEYGLGNLGDRLRTWPVNHIVSSAHQARAVEGVRLALAGTGFVTTALLAVLQRSFYWFPFSPLGFVVACAIGDYVGGIFFIVWLLKWGVLKYGGGPAYNSTRLVCIGIVVGHLAIAAAWGCLELSM